MHLMAWRFPGVHPLPILILITARLPKPLMPLLNAFPAPMFCCLTAFQVVME